MDTKTLRQKKEHDHQHGLNRYAVIPTALRLQADTELAGRGVTMALIDSGFYPHPDLTEPVNRIVAMADVTQHNSRSEANGGPYWGLAWASNFSGGCADFAEHGIIPARRGHIAACGGAGFSTSPSGSRIEGKSRAARRPRT
jgi:hypothetical protein